MRRACTAVVVVFVACSSVAWSSDRVRTVIEAESATEIVAPLVITDLEDASNGKCVTVPRVRGVGFVDPDPDARAYFRVRIPHDGNYRVWVHWQIRRNGCNCIWMAVDVDALTDKPDLICGSTYTPLHRSRAARRHALTAGEHVIHIHRFAKSAELDQILITNDLRYMPSRAMTETPEYLVRDEPEPDPTISLASSCAQYSLPRAGKLGP